MIDQDDYTYPVSALLDHGPLQARKVDEWFDYVGHYGLSERDVPQLIQLAGATAEDPGRPNQRDAPIHACRALGQLGDTAADIYLVNLLDDHENLMLVETVLVVLSLFGPTSIRILQRYTLWPQPSQESLVLVALGWFMLAQQYPQHRHECSQCLSEQLSEYEEHTPRLNGVLIYYLIQLQATEAATVIEQAFHSGQVDEAINGPWPAVQMALGLAKPHRSA